MKNKYLLFILAFAYFSQAYSQHDFWKMSSEKVVSKAAKMDRSSFPKEYQVFNTDLDNLKNALKHAPNIKQGVISPIVLPFPDSDGELVYFEIYDAPVIEKDLAKKFPGIKAYLGKGVKDKNVSLRFSITAFGLFAVINNPEKGTIYIDAYTADLKNYIVYNRETLPLKTTFKCLFDDNGENITGTLEEPAFKSNDPGVYREYRLAMACTVEYARFHINAARRVGIPVADERQKKEVVLSAMATTMTRVNEIYERDLSIHMNLIDNNDLLIFIDADDLTNDNGAKLIEEVQPLIDDIIGSDNYDIGHIVSTGGGGVAQLNAPCDFRKKAMGVTGSSSPVGDPFDVDYVAHEMGHQFGATHTFNNHCGGNIWYKTSVEPGSGNSIMGYANICAPNTKHKSDPFFHSISISQITKFINSVGDCSSNTPNNNPAPIANAGENRTIPKSTPFRLVGSAKDENNQDQLTYTWEQIDNEKSKQPPVSTSKIGPNFIYLSPSKIPIRFLPNFNAVLAEYNFPWEVLSSVERVFNFRFVVRDNNSILGGRTGYDEMKVVVANAGPFVITYPNSSDVEWESGSSQTIKWDVAGTTANSVNTSHVNIQISYDNGKEFELLVANTPNDGEENITVPEILTENARLLIEPVDNIYYALSKKFHIIQGEIAPIEENVLVDFKLYPNPTEDYFYIEFNAETDNFTIELYDVSGKLLSRENFKNVSTNIIHQQNIAHLGVGVYFLTVVDGQKRTIKKIIKR